MIRACRSLATHPAFVSKNAPATPNVDWLCIVGSICTCLTRSSIALFGPRLVRVLLVSICHVFPNRLFVFVSIFLVFGVYFFFIAQIISFCSYSVLLRVRPSVGNLSCFYCILVFVVIFLPVYPYCFLVFLTINGLSRKPRRLVFLVILSFANPLGLLAKIIWICVVWCHTTSNTQDAEQAR